MAASIIAGLMRHRVFDVSVAQHTSELFEKMPESQLVVFSGMLLKKPKYSRSSGYPLVYVSVTTDTLFISRHESEAYCMDLIHMDEFELETRGIKRSSSSCSEDQKEGNMQHGFELIPYFNTAQHFCIEP